VSVAHRDQRVKACLTLDPWLYVYQQEIRAAEMRVDVPFAAISTEWFHPDPAHTFPSWHTVKSLFQNNCASKQLNVVVRDTGHLHQCDLVTLIPFEMHLFFWVWF